MSTKVAEDVVATLAQRLPALAGSSADALVNLIRNRLGATRTGSHALDALHTNPAGADEQELAGAVLSDEMRRDPEFAAELAHMLGQPTAPNQRNTVTIGGQSRVRGDVAGGNIDKSKRYQIGSVRFGGGGLTALIVIGVLGLGGGGIAAYTTIQGSTGTPPLVQARTGAKVALGGISYDLDAENWRVTPTGGDDDGDQVVDIRLGGAEISAVASATVAPLASGVPLGADTCDRALNGQTASTISALKPTDVVCVRTSRGSIAALTISDLKANGQVYSIDFVYYAPEN